MARYPYDLFVTEGQSFKVIPFSFKNVPSGAESKQLYTLSTGWNFVMVGINSYYTQPFKINITNAFTGESLFTTNADVRIITGDGKNTFVCPKPVIFRKTESIELKVNNIGTSAGDIDIVLIGYRDLHGKQFYPEKLPEAKYKFERFYVLPFNFILNANQTLSDIKSISKEFDFQWEIFNSYSTGPYTLQVRDGFVNEDFFEGNVRGDLITGNGQYPFYLPIPYTFKGGTNIKVTAVDISGASNTIQIVFIGYKIKRL